MDTQCEGSYPRLLAGDDVTKFVLDGTHHLYPGLRMHNFSFASSAGWSAPDCREGEPASLEAQYRALFRDNCRQDSLDGRAMLGYDTMNTVIDARDRLLAKHRDVDGPRLAVEITRFDKKLGASGLLSFGRENGDPPPLATLRVSWRRKRSVLSPFHLICPPKPPQADA